jgi:type I restriction enzyme M protein
MPKAEIAGNDYDLLINRHKEVESDPPKVILQCLAKLEIEITEGHKTLERLLG